MKIGSITIGEVNEIRSAMCIIGPYEAGQLLKMNTHNRPLSPRVVAKYLEEMRLGEWVPTAAGIGIDESGVLTDGQHRLEAVVQYGKPVPLLVVSGLPSKSQMKQDRHNKRSLHSVFLLAGVCDNKLVVETATTIAGANGLIGLAKGVSDARVEAAIHDHGESMAAICAILRGNRKGVTQAGVRAAMTYAHELYPAEAEAFCRGLVSDAYIPTSGGDPIYRLARSLSVARVDGGYTRQRASYMKTCYAFNAYIEGRKISSVHEAGSIASKK